jgi:hypothetical protein
MSKEPLPLEADERLLGRWAVNYVSPAGWRFPGHLVVTERRVLFMGELEPQRIQPYIVGLVDATSVAYALDLDPEHVTYTGNHLCLSIPKAHIECVTPDCSLLNHSVSLTLRNNGSIHVFERSILSVTPLVQAIQESK